MAEHPAVNGCCSFHRRLWLKNWVNSWETYSNESWNGNPERSLLKRPVNLIYSVGRNVQRLGVEEPNQ
jgi:hypothetical protein